MLKLCLKFYDCNYSNISLTHSKQFYKIPIHPSSTNKASFKPVTLFDKNCAKNDICCELFIMLNNFKFKYNKQAQQYCIGDPIIYKNFLRVCYVVIFILQ